MDQKTLDHLKHKQLHWNIFYPNKTVQQMMSLHRGIEVAEIAPEFVVVMEKKRLEKYNGAVVRR